MRVELWVEPIQRRAIGADDLVLVAHIEEYVRMVERRGLAHAHEFLGADLDPRHAGVVMEMGDDVFRHGEVLIREYGVFGRTIARRGGPVTVGKPCRAAERNTFE